MTRIAPCLMFVGEQCGNAEAAMELYVSAFDGSRIVSVERFGPGDEGQRGIKQARFELGDGATVLMPLQAYDCSPRFGWLQDRFGVSWQLSLRAA